MVGCSGSSSDIKESLTEETLPYGVAFREVNDLGQTILEVKSDEHGYQQTHKYTYNADGLKSTERIFYMNHHLLFSIEYYYDASLKLIKQVDLDDEGNTTLLYSYDNNGNISSVSRNGLPFDTYHYNENNVLEKIENTKGNYTLFDSLGRKTEFYEKMGASEEYSEISKYNQHEKVSGIIKEISGEIELLYIYNDNGFITGQYQDILEDGSFPKYTTVFKYNSLGQLISVMDYTYSTPLSELILDANKIYTYYSNWIIKDITSYDSEGIKEYITYFDNSGTLTKKTTFNSDGSTTVEEF
ncbi:hypothetical protein DID78_05905 [Candidatus Marinamargulisbacteria bacterium SCGC AG-343-D04]|nr:hypothetical protein DID78_05905 [Candidatus Marinamargulisbacteria bacterium SCGC AG-343-D04]